MRSQSERVYGTLFQYVLALLTFVIFGRSTSKSRTGHHIAGSFVTQNYIVKSIHENSREELYELCNISQVHVYPTT